MQIIIAFANNVVAPYLMPGHVIILGIFTVGCIYAFIRVDIGIILGVICCCLLILICIYLITLLFPLASVSTMAYNLKQTKKVTCRSKYIKLSLASNSPFGLKVGTFFVLTKHSVLLLLLKHLEMLITLLIVTY